MIINNLDGLAGLYENKTEGAQANYLSISLKGEEKNPLGLGAKVSIQTQRLTQTQELTLTRGYQSSVEPRLHFGLGEATTIEKLTVIWANGNTQILENIPTNQALKLDFANSSSSRENQSALPSPTFTDISESSNIHFQHTEDEYNDFQFEPLLPHKNSQMGPAMAVGDINQDGLDDVFLGNAAGSSAKLFIQKSSGEFEELTGPWKADAEFEDTGALFFDADNDSDLDLYVVNGGNHKSKPASFYQDRLYLNTESGFVKSTQSLPIIASSGLSAIAGDYDGDGDQDLFVGGRIVPGKYPFPAQSYILRNEGGKDKEVRFTDATNEVLPSLTEAGLITSALWDDFNQDGKLDLIIAGEWTSIRFFQNNGAEFEEVTEKTGLKDQTGWWYSLEKADIDGDGDMDYIAGNLGLNYKYKASKEKPFEIYANDFDENGSNDIVLSYKKSGTKVPLRGRECSSQQVPAIKARFETYESFANATLGDIYGDIMLENSLHYKANSFAHQWFENLGDGTFKSHQLPIKTQFSSINSIKAFDYNHDAYPDLLVAGNLYQAEVETPRADASTGLVLVGSESGEFEVISPTKSGIMLSGEVKDIEALSTRNNQQAFIFGRNNQSVKIKQVAGKVTVQ